MNAVGRLRLLIRNSYPRADPKIAHRGQWQDPLNLRHRKLLFIMHLCHEPDFCIIKALYSSPVSCADLVGRTPKIQDSEDSSLFGPAYRREYPSMSRHPPLTLSTSLANRRGNRSYLLPFHSRVRHCNPLVRRRQDLCNPAAPFKGRRDRRASRVCEQILALRRGFSMIP